MGVKRQESNVIIKFQSLLKELFQFDSTDLDLGIYRIMNYKRKEIENFIENDLIRTIEKEFEKYKEKNQQELQELIEEKRNEIRKLEKELGERILKNGEIAEKFKDKPFVKEYTELKRRIEDQDYTENIQSLTFNDLYNFFSRYYEDGDFISKRRYSSRQHKYAIPYSGEEVKLYWANFDQYYIKTGEIFKDYEFKCKGWKFVFRTIMADVPVGNVKGDRRYFFLGEKDSVIINGNVCLINFEYRPLTSKDLKQYQVKTKEGKTKTTGITQDELNLSLKNKILDSIIPIEPKAILNETEGERTVLLKHLYKYTRKITSDFFIHKNLKEFLERELDYFIKTEVLDIESLDTEKERYFSRHITRAKVVKNIGKRVIEFLSQIEDFQKMLWEKKKFVLKTDYVVTIDRIPEEFYEEILKNKAQVKEWEELGFGKVKKKGDLIARRDLISTEYKKLPVDTKYFSEEFKERLLEKLGEEGGIDDLLDGILIKSENWQALNLLLGKYREKIKCIYIDPPCNTGSDEFLYKDKYQHSSWFSMMYDRLQFAREILRDDGVIFVSIDDNEISSLRIILTHFFDRENILPQIVVKRRNSQPNLRKGIAPVHDYLVSCTQNYEQMPTLKYIPEIFGIGSFSNPDNDPKGPWTTAPCSNRGGSKYKITTPAGIKYLDEWRFTKETYERLLKEGRIYFPNEGRGKPRYKIYLSEKQEQGVILNSLWDNTGTTQEAHKLIENLFSFRIYDNPKPIELIQRIGNITTLHDNIILDFFAGSGTTAHAVMKLNKEDGGKRKYILVEMADYFDTVIIPRLKKVCYSFNWKDGKPQDTDGISQMIKYHYLEQYEDTLHNIEFPQEEKGQKMLELFPKDAKTEYLMKYMLKFETEGSPSLLNLKKFETPFEYKLKIISSTKGEEIVNVDLVESFNYLLGLKINRYHFLNKNGRKYVIVLGERANKRTAIIWRTTKNIDLKKDKEIIDNLLKDFNPDEIFINGDSFVKRYKPIESEFKVLMEVQL